MSVRGTLVRLITGIAVAFAGGASPVVAQTTATGGAASSLPADAQWVVNLESLPERSAPDENSDPIATLRQFSYLAIVGYDGDWAKVFNPRNRTTGFVPSDQIGPTDSP